MFWRGGDVAKVKYYVILNLLGDIFFFRGPGIAKGNAFLEVGRDSIGSIFEGECMGSCRFGRFAD
jgi:hypothetical protein